MSSDPADQPASVPGDSYPRFAARDYPTALRIGALLGETDTSDVVVDAAVVVCARELSLAPVVTSNPEDLRKLDPVAAAHRDLTSRLRKGSPRRV
jgi:hypothetical protein